MEGTVLYDYHKTEDDELELRRGMRITDIKQVEGEWYEGLCEGKRGLFFKTYVKFRSPGKPQLVTSAPPRQPFVPTVLPPVPKSFPLPKASSAELYLKRAFRSPQHLHLPSPPPSPQPTSPTSSPLPSSSPPSLPPRSPTTHSSQENWTGRAKVMLRYTATDNDELSVQKGQVVDILGREEGGRNGWLMARTGDRIGLIPDSVVEVDTEETTKASGDIARAIYRYKAMDDDELSIEAGDIIEVMVMEDEGWWQAKLRGRTGLVPSNYVLPLALTPLQAVPKKEPSTTLDEGELESDISEEYLREAMKRGYVDVALVKVLVVGPAGVGKTSLLHLLLSKDPPETRSSTLCAERAIRVVRIESDSGSWSEISTEEFQEMIAEAVPVLYQELQAKGKDIGKLVEVLSTIADEEGVDGEGGERESEREGEEGPNRVSKKRLTTGSEDSSKNVISKVIQDLRKIVSSGKSSDRLLNMELIYLTDCGGQQAYWDLIPVFTYNTTATLFVHRLSESLDEHPLNDLYQRGAQVGPSQRASLTTAEAFKTTLRGLHKGRQRSMIITVGTHKDMADACEETPDEKNRKFAAIASSYFKDDLVYCNEGLEEIVFQLNTKSPGIDDKKVAKELRGCIEKGAKRHEIPIWWFILQLILEALAHKLGREILSKEECMHVSDSLGFSEGELDAALAFFDKLNIFLYKKAVLPGVVFTNVQVPLEKLSKLVEKQYHLRAALADPHKARDRATTGNWKKFRDHGILTLDFLKESSDHYVDGIFTASDFLVLLEELLIISRLSPTEFFFPAILDMTAEVRINLCLTMTKATKIAALVLHFPTGWVPPGVYCCTVCHLQSSCGWEVVKKPAIKPRTKSSVTRPTTQPRSISRNSIEFTKFGRPGSVTLIDNFSSFAVCVSLDTSKMPQDELIEHCQAIKSEIFTAVQVALKNTHDTNTCPTTAFLCPRQSDSCSTELHVAHLSSSKKQWICSENSRVFDTLSPEQTLWIAGSSGSPKPNEAAPVMSDLANHVAAVIPDKWKKVAVQLGLGMSEIRAIQRNEDDCFDQFMAVLEHWEHTHCKPFTWGTLVTVLHSHSVNEPRLARKLQQEFHV